MEKMFYWLVRWPWIAGLVVFLVLTRVSVNPWYISAWLLIGISLAVVVVARALKSRLLERQLALRIAPVPIATNAIVAGDPASATP